MVICSQSKRVAEWVQIKIGNLTEFHDCHAIGILRHGEIIGGVVIDNYVHNAMCSIHCAGEAGINWLTREFLHVVFDYVFRQLQCKVILNSIDSQNHASLKFTKHLGFREVHRIIGGGLAGSNCVLLEMQKIDCRWIKEENHG